MAATSGRLPGQEKRLEPHEVERKSPWILFAWLVGIVVGIVGVVVALDFLLLQGKEIASFEGVTFEIQEEAPGRPASDSPELTVEIQDPGKPHSLAITTGPQMLALRWSLTSDEGWLVAQGKDILRTDGLRVTPFVPNTAGPHTLRIDRMAGQPDHSAVGAARRAKPDEFDVSVRVNDRSIVKRLLRKRSVLGELFPELERDNSNARRTTVQPRQAVDGPGPHRR